jgi:hypothetical protein
MISPTLRINADTATALASMVDHPKRMSSITRHLGRVDRGRAYTTHEVELVGNRLQMCWSHAASKSASVIKLSAIWDWTDFAFVHDAMSAQLDSSVAIPSCDDAVALVVDLPRPVPMVIGLRDMRLCSFRRTSSRRTAHATCIPGWTAVEVDG